MANIQPEIDDFQNAVYGEEVRGSMISLARKLNTEVEAGSSTINQYTSTITQAISDANDAADAANDAATAASGAAGSANTAATAANTARTNIEANEAARQSAETARQNAEQGRVAAEQGRVTAEQGRTGAETARANAETARANAEAQRQANEAARQGAENERAAAEATRSGRETARVANEDLRIAQERDRVNAETERQRAFNNMSQAVIPPATTTTLGGVVVGDGLSVDANGKIDVVGGGDIETATHAAATYATKTELAEKASATHVHDASDVTSGVLPVARGGTGLASAPSLRTNLSSESSVSIFQSSSTPGVTGTLPVAHGGTGVTSNPSMLTNLGSTTADDVLKASPRPGVTGTLPIANGGTGATTAANARTNLDAAQSDGATGTLKDAEDAIDDLTESIAPVESTTATSNHAIGDYFMLGNVLMRATAAIATGEQITTSNATPATVQSQIDALRDSVGQLITKGMETVEWNTKTAWTYVGLSVTVPVNKPFEIAVEHGFNNSEPKGVCLSSSSTSMEDFRVVNGSAGYVSLAGMLAVSRTFYVWAKASSANVTNMVRMGYFFINQ
jgi:hypothetical protein